MENNHLLLSFNDKSSTINDGNEISNYVNQFTDVDRLILADVISCGRYSMVRRAFLEPDNSDNDDKRREFAVKIYQQCNKTYFTNERNVFVTPLMEHENLVKFYGAVDHLRTIPTEDSTELNSITEYWLITKFMTCGTLQDYLKSNTSDFHTMCKMALSVAKGLAYLHCETKKDGKLIIIF